MVIPTATKQTVKGSRWREEREAEPVVQHPRGQSSLDHARPYLMQGPEAHSESLIRSTSVLISVRAALSPEIPARDFVAWMKVSVTRIDLIMVHARW
jgi:hypothetical protein